jgi:hypothetical protein
VPPYANFPAPGTRHEGTIVRLSQVQSRKFVPPNLRAAGKQGELEFWPDQRPKMTAIVTIQTTLRDPNIQGDDGQRSLWIKGKNMETAVKAGIRNAGASRRGLEVGGYFGMTFTHTTPPEFEGGSPAKHYEADYLVPEQNPHRADGDPWANAAPPEGFIVNPATTPVAPDPASVPRGGPAYVATPTNDPRAQQASPRGLRPGQDDPGCRRGAPGDAGTAGWWPAVTAPVLPETVPVTSNERLVMALFGMVLALVRLYGGRAILRWMRRA